MNASQTTLSTVATGASYGALVDPQHARIAVENAIKKMVPGTIGSVLLFLTAGYSHSPQSAIKEAAKVAGTPQVFGCCAIGLLTEEDWLLDVEGAVAMLFPRELGLQPYSIAQRNNQSPDWALTFSSPNAASIAVNSINTPQFGAITSDEFGQGPFSVWQSGRIAEREFIHLALNKTAEYQFVKADGIKRVSPIMQINRSRAHTLLELDNGLPVDTLPQELIDNHEPHKTDQLFHLIAAVSENTDKESIANGHYKLHHVVSSDKASGQVHLSGSTKAGQHLFWAVRDEQWAQQLVESRLLQTKQNIKGTAKFAMMFSNISRGADFFNGRDQDFELFKQTFPNLPMVGFYGDGEITPGHRLSGLIQHHCAVFAIFT